MKNSNQTKFILYATYFPLCGVISLKSSFARNITSAMHAAAIYLDDPDCVRVQILDIEDNNRVIIDYEKSGA